MHEVEPTSVAEYAYLSTVRLLVDTGSARPEISSAFVVSANAETFLVTARHSVESARSTTVFFYSGRKGIAVTEPLTYEERSPATWWKLHPDPNIDLAIAPLSLVDAFFARDGVEIYASAIPTAGFAPDLSLDQSDLGIFRRPHALDEVFIVGYPHDYRDGKTSLPLMRRGFTATPLWLNHEERPVFLVDATVSHGMSGGPVFFIQEHVKLGKMAYLDSGQAILLGVFSEKLPPKTSTAREDIPIRPPNLGAVYKAHALMDLLPPARSDDRSG